MKKSAKSLDWDQRGQLWYPGWGTQTCQQFVHPASHLLWGRLALLVFPWAQFWLNQVAGQHQMVMHNGDHVTPALKLLWGPQTRGFPQQPVCQSDTHAPARSAERIPKQPEPDRPLGRRSR